MKNDNKSKPQNRATQPNLFEWLAGTTR